MHSGEPLDHRLFAATRLAELTRGTPFTSSRYRIPASRLQYGPSRRCCLVDVSSRLRPIILACSRPLRAPPSGGSGIDGGRAWADLPACFQPYPLQARGRRRRHVCLPERGWISPQGDADQQVARRPPGITQISCCYRPLTAVKAPTARSCAGRKISSAADFDKSHPITGARHRPALCRQPQALRDVEERRRYRTTAPLRCASRTTLLASL